MLTTKLYSCKAALRSESKYHTDMQWACLLQVSSLMSICWNNSLLTGIAFVGPANSNIAVAAYDTDEICIWALT